MPARCSQIVYSLHPSYAPSRLETALGLRRNFACFCIFFAIIHGTVESVISLGAAELGTTLGSLGGFCTYISYTVAALFFAKPLLEKYGSKFCIVMGFCGFFLFVLFFLISMTAPQVAIYLFPVGAAMGGAGAGVLWTAQGTYYSTNAVKYAQAIGAPDVDTVNNFSAVFAAVYLIGEAIVRLLATAMYMLMGSKADSKPSWTVYVGLLYVVASFTALVALATQTCSLDEEHGVAAINSVAADNSTRTSTSDMATAPSSLLQADYNSRGTTVVERRSSNRSRSSSSIWLWNDWFKDLLSVLQEVKSNRLLQYILPFQVCFGLSSGLVNIHVNAQIIKPYVGDGYIGLFGGISTLTAVLLSAPMAWLANRYKNTGKWILMVTGCVCFLFVAVPLAFMSNESIGASISFLVFYYCFYGAAMGVWQNTNKAVIVEYFPSETEKNAAFAAIYFVSGTASAFAFLTFKYMSNTALGCINIIWSVLALVSYHQSCTVHKTRISKSCNICTTSTTSTHTIAIIPSIRNKGRGGQYGRVGMHEIQDYHHNGINHNHNHVNVADNNAIHEDTEDIEAVASGGHELSAEELAHIATGEEVISERGEEPGKQHTEVSAGEEVKGKDLELQHTFNPINTRNPDS